MAPPGSAAASAYGWAPQPTPQPPQMQQFPPSAQPGKASVEFSQNAAVRRLFVVVFEEGR